MRSIFSSSNHEHRPTGPVLSRGVPLAWPLLALSLVATALVWNWARTTVDHARTIRFETRNHELAAAVVARIDNYEQVLRGASGLFLISNRVTFAQWHDYVANLDIDRHYAGVAAVVYAPYLHRGDLATFQSDLAGQSIPPLSIHPPGDRPVYVPVTYIEPFTWRNQRAFGFDMYADPIRRAAIDEARDTGDAVLTGPLTLLQEPRTEEQGGVLLYLPLFQGIPVTVEQRREKLFGVVYLPIRLDLLMLAVFGPNLNEMQVVLYDGPKIDQAHLIYNSLPEGNEREPSQIEHIITIPLPHRTWTLQFLSRPSFERQQGPATPQLILVTGIVISVLLFGVALALSTTRARALGIARRMTHELSEERTRLSEIAVTLGEGVLVLDAIGNITFSNPAAQHLLGWEHNGLLARNSRDLLAPEALARGFGISHPPTEKAAQGQARYAPEETTFRRRDGTLFPVSVVSTPIMRQGTAVGSVVAFQDISERKRAEEALREGQQFATLFQYSGDALFLLDLNGKVIDANHVALETLGYSRKELIGGHVTRYERWSTIPQPGKSLTDLFDTTSGEQQVLGEAEYVRKNGSSILVEAAFSPIEHENEKLILVSARDISERKEAERKIQRALDDLEASRLEIEEVNRRLAESNRELERLSRRDGLTGIANRRSFDEYLALEWNRAARDHRPISLLMADVDHFKPFNDYYGHPVGDECLRRIAAAIDQQLSRSIDVVARYGGEEFVVVLPETPLSGALNIAERLRRAVEDIHMPHARSPVGDHVTISLGAATMIPSGENAKEDLVTAADKALYQAKREGRNRVCAAEGPAEPES